MSKTRISLAKEQLAEDGRVLTKQHCPVCGYEFDAASGMTHDHRPRPGDVSLCIKCGEVFEFDADMRIVQASLSTMLALNPAARAEVEKMQAVIRKERLKG